MPPRIRIRPRALRVRTSHHPSSPLPITAAATATYASLATATTPAPPIQQMTRSVPPVLRYPPTQPPSHKPPEVRKTQLHRQYQSLIKSSPLILIFQHNNVKAVEWMSIRRELSLALAKVDAERIKNGEIEAGEEMAADIRFQVIQTGIFASALRIVEFFDPENDAAAAAADAKTPHATDPSTPTSKEVPQTSNDPHDQRFTHGLSRRAYEAATGKLKNKKKRNKLDLDPLLSGPLAVVSFPAVSPQHLKSALSILSPSPPTFPAPRRKANPDYHEPAVHAGLQKLMLLGARVEGKVFDVDGTKWVGGIEGGLGGLRAQLVAMLQGVGGGVTSALEGASKSLWVTLESRRVDMDEKENPKKDEEGEEVGEKKEGE